jgi:hypothetical protein
MKHVIALTIRSHRRDAEAAARPLLVALPQVLLALLVLAVGFAAAIAWPWVVAIACSLVLVALAQAIRAAVELQRRRRAADQLLLCGAVARPSSELLTWRAGELTSPRLRSMLARSLRHIEREAKGATRPGPVPLNTRALRCHTDLVCALRERLEDQAHPVSPRGMVLVDRLLTEPGSPLHSHVPDTVLAEAMNKALAALDQAPARAAA